MFCTDRRTNSNFCLILHELTGFITVVFTARYALNPYIKQIRFVFKGLTHEDTVGCALWFQKRQFSLYVKRRLLIHLVQLLSYDRFIASSKTSSPHALLVLLFSIYNILSFP